MHGAACTGLRWPPRLACPRHDEQMITCSLSPPRLFDGAPSRPSRLAMWATRGLLSHCAANGCKTRQPASQFCRQPKRTATYVAPRGRRRRCRSLGQAQRGCPHAAARCTAPRCGLITHREGSPRVQACSAVRGCCTKAHWHWLTNQPVHVQVPTRQCCSCALTWWSRAKPMECGPPLQQPAPMNRLRFASPAARARAATPSWSGSSSRPALSA